MHALTDGRDTPPRRGPGGRRRDRGQRRARRHGLRPLLGDGPRPALGPHQARLRRDGPRRRRAAARAPPRRSAPPTTAGVTDEFIEPAVIGDPARRPGARRRRGRLLELPPRPRAPAHRGARRARLRRLRPRRRPAVPALTTMTRYKAEFDRRRCCSRRRTCARAWPRRVERAGRRQLHVAETEKYAHVTFFFNGGREEPFDGRGARAGARRPSTSPPTTRRPR